MYTRSTSYRELASPRGLPVGLTAATDIEAEQLSKATTCRLNAGMLNVLARLGLRDKAITAAAAKRPLEVAEVDAGLGRLCVTGSDAFEVKLKLRAAGLLARGEPAHMAFTG